MILLNDNDLCLISGGTDLYNTSRKFKKSKHECKKDFWNAFWNAFWDSCTIISETVKFSGVLWLTAYTIGLTNNTPGDLLKWLNKQTHPKERQEN